MSREVADRWCERGILALVLAILVFGPLALGAVRALEFSIIEVLALLTAVLWSVRLWLNPRPQLLWPPICWAVLAFVTYAIVRYCQADIEYVARQELLRILVYALLFFAVLNNLHRQESTQIISFTLIFLAMAIAAYAVYQFIADSKYVWFFPRLYPHRGSGTYVCPNHLGGFLELLLPLGLAYTLLGRLKPVTRVFMGYASLVILAGIAATVSRGAWVSTAVALGFFFLALLFRRGYRLPVLVLLVVMVGAGAYILPQSFFLQVRMRQLFTQQGKVNDDMRFALWEPAFRLWQDHPWWGVGPAHFDARFAVYRPEGVQMSPDRTHNDYLNTLADWGLTGAVLVASAWVLLGIGIAKTWPRVRLTSADLGGKSGSNKFAFLLGASLGLLAILAHSFVDFNMHIPANAILVVTLMALITSHLRFATDRWWFRAKLPVKLAATTTVLAAAAYVAPQAWRQATEFVWLERAEVAPAFSKQQIDLLKHAEAIEPNNPKTAFAIAEALRHESQEGGEFYEGQQGVTYRQLAEQAITWYQRGMKLNPYDSRNYAGCGWCLDWLDRPNESSRYFDRAEELDPNNYFNLNNIGLHYVQLGDYAAAKPWFERSIRLEWQDNPVPRNYLPLINNRLLESATNEFKTRVAPPPEFRVTPGTENDKPAD